MSIYICGACNTGKAEIARRIGMENTSLQLHIDPADTVFVPIFGVGLDRIFRGRKWEGKTDETYQSLCEYLSLLEQEDIITNEGPLLLLSHMMFFGVLSVFNDEQRKGILTRCLALLRRGKHFIVRRWIENGNFNEISVSLQREFRNGRENIFTIPPATDYDSTVEQAVEYIKGKMEVK